MLMSLAVLFLGETDRILNAPLGSAGCPVFQSPEFKTGRACQCFEVAVEVLVFGSLSGHLEGLALGLNLTGRSKITQFCLFVNLA